MEIVPNNSASPFEAIKQTRPDGTEFWTARDLMEKLGYSNWQNFVTAIERAKMTAVNQGMNLDLLFIGISKKSFMGRPKEDYELSRYAAYLVSLNGDPRKPEVAAAQSYFVVRTREAETQKPQTELTRKEILLLALEAEERAEKAEAKVIELEPAATSYNHWKQKDNGMSRRKLCQKLREVYPGMNEARLREHMIDRRDLVKEMKSDGEYELVPASAMYSKGFATRYWFKDKKDVSRVGYGWTFAYYEELVKRFSKTLTPAGQQEMMEIA